MLNRLSSTLLLRNFFSTNATAMTAPLLTQYSHYIPGHAFTVASFAENTRDIKTSALVSELSSACRDAEKNQRPVFIFESGIAAHLNRFDCNGLSHSKLLALAQTGNHYLNMVAASPIHTMHFSDSNVITGRALEIALAFDERFCKPHANFNFSHVFHGCTPHLNACQNLTHILGDPVAAARLIAGGNPFSANDALELGIVAKKADASHMFDVVAAKMRFKKHYDTPVPRLNKSNYDLELDNLRKEVAALHEAQWVAIHAFSAKNIHLKDQVIVNVMMWVHAVQAARLKVIDIIKAQTKTACMNEKSHIESNAFAALTADPEARFAHHLWTSPAFRVERAIIRKTLFNKGLFYVADTRMSLTSERPKSSTTRTANFPGFASHM